MRCLLILFPLSVVGVYSDDNCESVRADFQACTQQAYATYTAAYRGGGDGRDSFSARKTCNYMTDALEVCPEKLRKDGCTSDEGVMAMKDRQMHSILKQVKSSVAEWDSCKCPPIKAHLDRMKAKVGAKVAEECPALVPSISTTLVQEQQVAGNEEFDLSFGGVLVATSVLLAKPLSFLFL